MARNPRTSRPSYRPASIPGYVPYDANKPANKRAGALYARGYLNIRTNAQITRRDYLDLQARNSGWSSIAQYAAISKSAGGLSGPHSGTAQLILATMNNAGIAPHERRETARKYASILQKLERDPENLDANGPLAQWLEAIGLRDPGWTFDVGDTPHFYHRMGSSGIWTSVGTRE